MAHLLEHMLFKGTPKYPDVWAVLKDKGAINNATTWFDRTNYFETLPATDANLAFALDFEADRMLNSWIRKEDLASEMTVVRNEFEMGENNPVGVLLDKIMSAGYEWHNYGKSTIGNRSDIERVSIDSLKQFYVKYYQPDNAVLIIAGRFDEKLALAETMKVFGQLPKPSRTLEETYTEEPVQDGSRRVKLLRSGDVATAGAAYHIPAGSHADHAAIAILSNVMTSEPSGYIYDDMVKKGDATEVTSFAFSLAEPGMFLIFAKPAVVKNIYKIEKRMLDLVEKENKVNITEEAVNRAKANLLKKYKLAMGNSKNLALKLSESIAQGGFELFFWYRDEIKKVTVADVKRVAKKYLIKTNRTAGVFIPTKRTTRAEIPGTPNVQEALKDYKGSENLVQGDHFDASIENIEKLTLRKTIDNGIKLALLPKQTRGDVVKAQLVFKFGNEKDMNGHTEALGLIPSMLMRGTNKLSFQQIQDKLDQLQSSLKLGGGAGGVVANLVTDRSNLTSVLDLLTEIMQNPQFDLAEFEIIQKQSLSDLEESLTDPQQVGFNELARLQSPWPKSNFHYIPTLEEKMQTISNLKIADLANLYANFYGANHLEVSAIGSFDPDDIQKTLNKHFGKWISKKTYQRVTKPYIAAENKLQTVVTPDKQMAIIAMAANMKLQDDNPDFAAIRFANYIFGENSMKSYLMERLRQKEGLSYGAGSWVDASQFEASGSITMYAMAATANADKALNMMEEEYQNLLTKPIDNALIEEAKQSFKTMFDSRLANDDYLNAILGGGLESGRTLLFQAQLLERIANLTADQINKALQKYLTPEPLAKVKAGDIVK